jgi:hypothetical protein
MSERIGQFDARDAAHYLESYRSAIRKQAAILREELEVKQKRLWDDKEKTPFFYAELRALEDALRHVTKGEEPGWVVLGDSAPQPETGCDPAELAECQKKAASYAEERFKLESQYKELVLKSQELQAMVIRQRQDLAAVYRRLEQNNSTFMVVLATMFMVILVQLYLLWAR